jgi:hypothetical protein
MVGMKLSMNLELKQIDKEPIILKEIYDIAKKKNKIIQTTIGEYTFDYALINSKDKYGNYKYFSDGKFCELEGYLRTEYIKNSEKDKRVGFGFNKNYFVLEKNLLRLDFAPYVGLHEYVENNIYPYTHANACMVELGEVFKREDSFIKDYSKWITDEKLVSDGYFEKAAPKFIKMAKKEKSDPVEIIKDFKYVLALIYFQDTFLKLN